MMSSLERVTAALELREPDRVPTMDVMEEYSNIYEILGRKPIPLGFLVGNKYASKAFSAAAPLINKFHVIDREMDHFSHDRVEASVKLGYDSVWTMHVPIWRFKNSEVTTDIYGREYAVVVDDRGNIGTPMYLS